MRANVGVRFCIGRVGSADIVTMRHEIGHYAEQLHQKFGAYLQVVDRTHSP